MANQQQKQQEGFDGALDSIFKFIFESAEKGPQKGMPPSRAKKGSSGSDEFTTIVGEFIEKPWLATSDSLLGAVEGMVGGAELAKFYAGRPDASLYQNMDPESGRFRVRLSDLGTFLTNPGKAIDKAYDTFKKQQDRMRLAGAARGVDFVVGMLYANNEGMSMKDAWEMGAASGTSFGEKLKGGAKSVLEEKLTEANDFGLAAAQAVGMGGWVGGTSRRVKSTQYMCRTTAMNLSTATTAKDADIKGDKIYKSFMKSGAAVESYAQTGPVFGFFAKPEVILPTDDPKTRAAKLDTPEKVRVVATKKYADSFLEVRQGNFVQSKLVGYDPDAGSLKDTAVYSSTLGDYGSVASDQSGQDLLISALITGHPPEVTLPLDQQPTGKFALTAEQEQSALKTRQLAARVYGEIKGEFEEHLSEMQSRERTFQSNLQAQGFSEAEAQEIVGGMVTQADIRKKHFITDSRERLDHFTPGAYRATFIGYQGAKIRKLENELGKLRAIRSASGHGAPTAREQQITKELLNTQRKLKLTETWQELRGDVDTFDPKIYENTVGSIKGLVKDAHTAGDMSLVAGLTQDLTAAQGVSAVYTKKTRNWEKNRESGAVFGGRGKDFAWTGYTDNATKILTIRLKAELRTVEKKLADAQRRGFVNKINDLLSERDVLLSQRRKIWALKGASWRLRTGNALLAFDSVKNMWDGGLLSFSSIVGGSAFFANPFFSPGSLNVFKAQSMHKKKGMTGAAAWGVDPFGGVGNSVIVMPKDGPMYGVNKALVNLYYLTPASVMKTFLWNGEGFKYIATMANRSISKKLIEMIKSDDNLKKGVYRWLRGSNDSAMVKTIMGALGGPKGVSLSKFLDSDDFYTLITQKYGFVLEKIMSLNDAELMKLFRDVDSIQRYMPQIKKLVKRFKKVSQRFDKLARLFQKPMVFYNKTVLKLTAPFKKVTNTLVRKLLEKLFKKHMSSEWMKTVTRFLAKDIGIQTLLQTLAKTLVQALLQAVGAVTTGFIANVLIAVVTWLIPKVLGKVTKAGFKILAWTAYLVVGSLVLLTCIGANSVMNLLPATHQTPLQVSGNMGGPGGSGISASGNPNEWSDTDGVGIWGWGDNGPGGSPRPTNEAPWTDSGGEYACPVGGSGYSCAQGSHPSDPNCSHYNLPGVDFTAPNAIFKAPTNMEVTKIGYSAQCGTHVEATDVNGNIFRLYHVVLPDNVSMGTQLARGDDWAWMAMHVEAGPDNNPCWTGPHYHFDVRNSSHVYYDAEAWIRQYCPSGTINACADPNCSIPNN